MTILIITEAVVIVLLVILVAGLLRSHAEILKRLHALDGGEDQAAVSVRVGGTLSPRPAGSAPPATAIMGRTPDGVSRSIALAGSRGLTALAFMSSTCTGCKPFWRSFREDAAMPIQDMRLVVVTKGPEEESPAAIADLAGGKTTVVMSSEAWDDFSVPASPFFVLVDAADGAVIGEGSGPSWRRVSRMLTDAVGDDRTASRFEAGNTANRIRHTDDVLHDHGITADDPSLWSDPVQDGHP